MAGTCLTSANEHDVTFGIAFTTFIETRERENAVFQLAYLMDVTATWITFFFALY